jgi:hypothetical protein
MIFLTTLAACNNGSGDQPTAEPFEESGPSAPTATLSTPAEQPPTMVPTAYPPPGSEAGYPISTPLPAENPYPGGLVTIIHPMGSQCEGAIFSDLSAAIGSLEEAGITVLAAEEIGLEVCEACGCATSEHYRLQINVEDLDAALEMGWQRWPI